MESNLRYVRNPRHKEGLGLVDIHSNVRGLVIIGRRHGTPPSTNATRRRLAATRNVDIHSWDWLVERAQMRSDELEGRRLRGSSRAGLNHPESVFHPVPFGWKEPHSFHKVTQFII